jgi:hypothetical protein
MTTEPVRKMIPQTKRDDPPIASKPEPVRKMWINGKWVESK